MQAAGRLRGLPSHSTSPLPDAPPPPHSLALQHAVSVRYATEHRCGVVVRGVGLSDQISGTDPLRDNLPLLVRGRLVELVGHARVCVCR